ncbi:MAG TPA: hypothetical protein VKA06_10205, partial [Spirochaetia bacterium]|nr:hypothetical protein [Spirochaetia bacterium]
PRLDPGVTTPDDDRVEIHGGKVLDGGGNVTDPGDEGCEGPANAIIWLDSFQVGGVGDGGSRSQPGEEVGDGR